MSFLEYLLQLPTNLLEKAGRLHYPESHLVQLHQ